ncbi:MAG: cysteine hydrolase [Lachnospiraceae bacterium]|nr:cysteine hydrolase [Lachnospiraceae bacterium]
MNILIVVDMQKDFIDGSLGTKEAEDIVGNVRKKIEGFDGKLIFTRDTHQENYLDTFEGRNLPVKHCIENTDGWEISAALKDLSENAVVINKPTFGYTGWTSLIGDEPSSIELCGLCTDICVISNALILRALYPEVPMTVDSSCCAGVTPEKHEAALSVMESCQIKVIR